MKTSYTLAEIAKLTETTLIGDPSYTINFVADLETAKATDASFLSNPRYEQAMQRSSAGVIFIHPHIPRTEGKNFLIAEDPSFAFQKLVLLFNGEPIFSGFKGIHESAVIHPSARLGKNIQIGPNAVIDEEVEIGDNTIIGAGVYIGPKTKIGTHSLLHPNVTIREKCTLGNRVIIQSGTVIGSCGFGYITDKQGKHIKLEQLGTVIIEDDVEIGANTTIDRARFKMTRIGQGTKIDNLVQIAHGVVIGKDNLIVSQTGIAGSSETGNHVILAAQVGVSGHVHITDGSIITARSGISKSITQSGKYGGAPTMPLAEHNRNQVQLRSIDKYLTKIKDLEARLEQLEKK